MRPRNIKRKQNLRSRIIIAVAAAIWIGYGTGVLALEQEANAIYTGGDIITMSDSQPSAEAIAVKDGKILAVGAKADVLKYRGSATKVVDLGGKTLLPGFIDAHGHVFNTGLQVLAANLLAEQDGTVNDIAALLQSLRDWAQQHPERLSRTGWIIGFSYDDAQLKEQRHPTRDDLDAVSKTMSVMAIHQSGHLAAINSKGLEVAGITAASKDPAGGVYRRREGGSEPDGLLEEMAFLNLLLSLPPTSTSRKKPKGPSNPAN